MEFALSNLKLRGTHRRGKFWPLLWRLHFLSIEATALPYVDIGQKETWWSLFAPKNRQPKHDHACRRAGSVRQWSPSREWTVCLPPWVWVMLLFFLLDTGYIYFSKKWKDLMTMIHMQIGNHFRLDPLFVNFAFDTKFIIHRWIYLHYDYHYMEKLNIQNEYNTYFKHCYI